MQAWGFFRKHFRKSPFRELFLVDVFQVFPNEEIKDNKRYNSESGNQLDCGKEIIQV